MADGQNAETLPMECRICHCKTTRGLILSPCLCKGSLANVHVGCLERWLNQAHRESCELCGRRFVVVLRRRNSLFGSVRCWLRQPARRTILIWHMCFAAALTMFTLALLLFSHLAIRKFREIDQRMNGSGGPSWSLFEAVIGVSLVLVLAAYLNTIYSMVSDNLRSWQAWWVTCNHITLVLDNYEILDSGEKSGEEREGKLADCNDNFEPDNIYNDSGAIKELGTRIENIV